jgi:hypothetical protein
VGIAFDADEATAGELADVEPLVECAGSDAGADAAPDGG